MWSQSFLLCACFIGINWMVTLSDADSCPELYQRYSKDHTYCIPANAACTVLKSYVDDDDQSIIVKEHNKFRNNVAMGEETIGPLPTAADMLQMSYDDELAAIAQKHADQCKFEHDCNECRQSMNFEVGQNIYTTNGNKDMPTADWGAAVKSWYSEVSDFDPSIIPSFDDSQVSAMIGHFTQLVWAKSWKIGCGYSVYKEGDSYTELYVCNYGPGGNVFEAPMYKTGETCSACPINSCCGATCGQTDYPGLCKITDDRAPQYKPKFEGDVISYCDFETESMCPIQSPPGVKQWQIYSSLSGSYAGVVLEGGESSTVNVTKTFKSDEVSCLSLYYRKGPNVAGEGSANTATEHYSMTKDGSNFDTELGGDSSGFTKMGMDWSWAVEFLFAITFSVPAGEPAQYFEFQSIVHTKGAC